MTMIIDFLLIVVGIALVLWGANRMTDGAVAIAHRLHIAPIVIGLTIVAMGTSMPEFCVSLVSALKGTPDLAIGNVVGSNSMNVLLIVGVAAMVAPMAISRTTVKRDMPWAVASSVLLALFCLDKSLSRWEALALFVLFVVFLCYTVWSAKKGGDTDDDSGEAPKQYGLLTSICWIAVGLACLIGGSNLFVDAATRVAQQMGVSEAVIGLTIVAGGTSLPELATSVVAARKGQSAIAIGNVIGSNVFNILMILGITGLISPMQMQGITTVDLAVMVGSVTLLLLFCYTKYTVERWEGAVLTALECGYMAWLVSGAM